MERCFSAGASTWSDSACSYTFTTANRAKEGDSTRYLGVPNAARAYSGERRRTKTQFKDAIGTPVNTSVLQRICHGCAMEGPAGQ